LNIRAVPLCPTDGIVTGPIQQLTRTVVENAFPFISPDGSRMVFTSDRQKNTDIILKNLLTGAETALTTTDVNEFSPFLSRDGANVLYYVFRPEQTPSFSFWVVKTDGGPPRHVCADCNGQVY